MSFPVDVLQRRGSQQERRVSKSGVHDYTDILGDSEDSDEDPNSEKLLTTSWEELSITDRLGLKSSLEMEEEEVERAFTQFALGFRCDQYTRTQRLQAEEHDRIVAQENLQRELGETRETLQVLYERLVGVESREMVLQMEERLQMMESSMENVITTAEKLGAAHQEARVSNAAELMRAHVDHLQKRHNTETSELLEVRKLFNRRRGRLHSDSTDERDLLFRQPLQPTRRRVSVTLLPTQAQMKDLELMFLDGIKTSTDRETQTSSKTQTHRRQEQEVNPAGSPGISPPRDPRDLSAHLLQEDSTQDQDEDDDSAVFPSVMQNISLCRRRRRDPTKHKKSSGEETLEGEGPSKWEGHLEGEESSLQPDTHTSSELCLTAVQRPLLSRLSDCQWSVRFLSLLFCLLLIAALLCLNAADMHE